MLSRIFEFLSLTSRMDLESALATLHPPATPTSFDDAGAGERVQGAGAPRFASEQDALEYYLSHRDER